MVSMSKIICYVIAKGIRFLAISFGKRPIVLLDSYLRQLDWIGVSMPSIYREGLKRGMFFVQHRVKESKFSSVDSGDELDLQATHRGVNLFSTVEYLLYVSLEIARHEFDPDNPAHRREANRWMGYARAVTDELIALFDRMHPSVVVIMQGYFVESAIARQLAGRFAYQVIAMENTFYSQRLICEPITGISVNKNSAMAWYYHDQDRGNCGTNDGYLDDLMMRIDATKLTEHASPKRSFIWPKDRKRILFLGQCYTDSSLLFGTSGRYSTIEAVRLLLDYAKQRGVFAMLKLHPKENSGDDTLARPYNQLSLRRLLAAGLSLNLKDHPGQNDHFSVDTENTFATPQLIKDADVIVTINSQGGLEALALGKEVVLLGGAFYDRLGTTWNAPHLAVLPAILDSILKDGLRLWNRRRIAQFLWTYFEHYCVKKDAKSVVTAIKARGFHGF